MYLSLMHINSYAFITNSCHTLWQNCNILLSIVNHTRQSVNSIFSSEPFPWNSPIWTVWFLGLCTAGIWDLLLTIILRNPCCSLLHWILCFLDHMSSAFWIYCPRFFGYLLQDSWTCMPENVCILSLQLIGSLAAYRIQGPMSSSFQYCW